MEIWILALMTSGRKRGDKGVRITPPTVHFEIVRKVAESSSPGESHPQALTDPDVNLSIHPALIVQPH
jgi:hypothetical protein